MDINGKDEYSILRVDGSWRGHKALFNELVEAHHNGVVELVDFKLEIIPKGQRTNRRKIEWYSYQFTEEGRALVIYEKL
jgi:hypothetical protein